MALSYALLCILLSVHPSLFAVVETGISSKESGATLSGQVSVNFPVFTSRGILNTNVLCGGWLSQKERLNFLLTLLSCCTSVLYSLYWWRAWRA